MNRWAGWGIVVAYRDASQPLRRLHVYDGLRGVQSAAPTADIALGDFLTPASGTVRGRLALLSWDGRARHGRNVKLELRACMGDGTQRDQPRGSARMGVGTHSLEAVARRDSSHIVTLTGLSPMAQATPVAGDARCGPGRPPPGSGRGQRMRLFAAR
jgi:hypothetical protein